MAAHNICFYNKYGFCKFLEKCRRYHENKICEKSNCEIRECPLRHPKVCKFYRDFGFCKFNEWCKFFHKDGKKSDEKAENLKKIEARLKAIENEFEKKCEKVSKLENDLKDMFIKVTEKDQTISKINKKLNVLKEKVTLLFDLEGKYEAIEKKVEEINKKDKDDVKEKESEPLTNEPTEACSNNSEENKCPACDFIAKNRFGLKIHFHKKHSMARFKCFTCDFTCENKTELNEHNERYYYSHRQVLNKNYEKSILDEIQQLDEDGYIVHRTLDW